MTSVVSLIEQRLQSAPTVEIPYGELSPSQIAELEHKGYTVLVDMDSETGKLLFYTIERHAATPAAPAVPRSGLCALVMKFLLLCILMAAVAIVVFFNLFAYVTEMEFLVAQMQAHKMRTEMPCSAMMCIHCSWKGVAEDLHSQVRIYLPTRVEQDAMRRAFWDMCNKCCTTLYCRRL